jgi:hypothetical protein
MALVGADGIFWSVFHRCSIFSGQSKRSVLTRLASLDNSDPGWSIFSQAWIDPDLISAFESNALSCFLLRSVEMVSVMINSQKNNPSPRDRELFLGNLVTWGSIISALALAISLAPASAVEEGQRTASLDAEPSTQAVTIDAGLAGSDDKG